MELTGLIDEFLAELRLNGRSPLTIKSYRAELQAFDVYTGKPLDEIDHRDVRRYLMHKQTDRGNSKASIARAVHILRSFWKWLSKEDYVHRNVMDKIEVPKQDKPLPKYLTDDEVAAVKLACADLRERALIELLFSSGMRIRELYQLNRRDIEFDARRVTVLGKGSKERHVYFSREAVTALQEYLGSRSDNDEALFLSGNGNRWSIRAMQRVVSNLGKRAGLSKSLTPHKGRHSFATKLLEQGVPIEVVQELLGHSSIETTRIYGRVTDTRKEHEYHKVFD